MKAKKKVGEKLIKYLYGMSVEGTKKINANVVVRSG